MADNKKQYYTNLNPGETAIESRLGSKIVMDQKGGVLLTTSRRTEYIDQLRQENYQGNINPNPDDENSYLYVGTGQVELNQQGSTNQQSLELENKISDNIIAPSPDKTSQELPEVEETNSNPPTITNVNPIEAFRGDEIEINGTNFIEFGTTITLGGVSVERVEFFDSTRLIVIVGNGSSGDIIVKTSNGSVTYKDKFVYKGITTTEDGEVVTEEDLNALNIDDENGCVFCPDQDEGPDNSPVEITQQSSTKTACVINPSIILNKNPLNWKDCIPKNSTGAITPYQDFCAAAKASLGTKTGRGPSADITINGRLACATAVSIIYLRATGHSIDWVKKNNPSTKIGKYIGGSTGTASVLSHMRKDKTNWEEILVYKPGASGYLGNWDYAWPQFQPGDCINTVTINGDVAHGHIGWVIDTKFTDGVSYDVSNNLTSRTPSKCVIARHYTVKSWGKIAKIRGVGSTYLFRFKGTWGVTISVP